ncbi:hypothetical protein [Rivularia sp. UHCC 0363]|uniref:hypothetical protein n=1 Tax=Rivularia sp. UHCC 0363 TaxID=3110244 RepID=UPI002B21DFC5|nr:hypothetical protein [Rivularia sp. UHCC 0363]MEA5595132.1 hypothetical protein [Rivularia sp. UHCC 0363]
MNTHTFDNHYVTCPICQKNPTAKGRKSCAGLYNCPYCQERLVVCRSGNFVRDPFPLKQITLSSVLRRQSRPVARILRDFVFFKHPLIAFILGSAIILGIITVTQTNTAHKDIQKLSNVEKISDIEEK